MADQQIQLPNVGALPTEWTVPGALSILLKCVQADFDGSGAGSAFLPTVEIVSDAGLLVGRAFTDASVAAGGSASVTFAPFLEGAAAASTPYAPSPVTGVYNVAPVNITGPGSSTGSLVYVRGSAVLDLSTPTSPTVVTRGVYFIGGSFKGNAAFTAGRGLLGLLFVNSSPTVDAYMSAETQSPTIGPQGFLATTVPCAANTNMSFTLTNRDTATRSCEWNEIIVTLVCVY